MSWLSTLLLLGSSPTNVEVWFMFALFNMVWVTIFFVLVFGACACHQWMSRRRTIAPVNNGLNKQTLESLPELSFTGEHTQKFSECPICLMEYMAGDKIRVVLPCGHGFHVGCVDMWLVSHSSCPFCRRQVIVPVESQDYKELPI
nr:hypothetical protein DM860_016862 [Ipomoea trifida]GMD10963.1 RING-H2 finger protein ATL80-like [Ipomoea batatas]